MAEILMVGAFGQRNPGDEALCRAICGLLGGHDVVIASSDPVATRAQHHRRAIPASARSVASALRHCDAVVVGGGTLFKVLHPSSGRRPNALLRNTAILLAAARARRIPVALVGVGAGELRGAGARRLARRIARDADLMVLRDEESAAVLTGAGVEPPFWIGADPAWLLFDPAVSAGDPDATPLIQTRPARRSRASGAPRATVAVSHLAGGSEGELDRLLAGIGAALAKLVADGWEVRLQAWQPGADEAVVAQLGRLVPEAQQCRAATELSMIAADYADDELVVAMRFHALLAAGAARRRSVTVAHEPKLSGLARQLDQIAVPTDASEAVIASAFDWALDHDPPTAAAVARQIGLAADTGALVRVLVTPDAFERPDELPALRLSDGEGRW